MVRLRYFDNIAYALLTLFRIQVWCMLSVLLSVLLPVLLCVCVFVGLHVYTNPIDLISMIFFAKDAQYTIWP